MPSWVIFHRHICPGPEAAHQPHITTTLGSWWCSLSEILSLFYTYVEGPILSKKTFVLSLKSLILPNCWGSSYLLWQMQNLRHGFHFDKLWLLLWNCPQSCALFLTLVKVNETYSAFNGVLGSFVIPSPPQLLYILNVLWCWDGLPPLWCFITFHVFLFWKY